MKKSKLNPNNTKPISTHALSELADRLFDPNLKPPRVINPPRAPSIAGSKLPPPLAEVDERPTWRVRRFRLWTDNAPSLYLAVLDPRRRGHLRRYQSYALPNVATWVRGVQSIPVQLRPKPDPTRPAPYKPLVMPRTPYPSSPTAKIPRWEKNARWQRLLQFKYALDQEHERRFRRGMRELIDQVMEFEWDNMVGYGKWDTNPWREKVDIARATSMIQFFKDIRKKSINIYHHLSLAQIPILPVPRREELHRAVKAENKRREDKRARKEARQAAREASQRAEAEILASTASHITDEEEKKSLGLDVLDPGFDHGLPLAGELAELEAIRYQIRQMRTGGPLIRAPKDDGGLRVGIPGGTTPTLNVEDKEDDDAKDTEVGIVQREREEDEILTDTPTLSSETIQTPVNRDRPVLFASVSEPILETSKNEDPFAALDDDHNKITRPDMSHRATAPIPGEVFSSDPLGKALSRIPRRVPHTRSKRGFNDDLKKNQQDHDEFSVQDISDLVNSLYERDNGDRAAERALRQIATISPTPSDLSSRRTDTGSPVSSLSPGDSGDRPAVSRKSGVSGEGEGARPRIPQRQLFIIQKPEGLDEEALMRILPQLYSRAKDQASAPQSQSSPTDSSLEHSKNGLHEVKIMPSSMNVGQNSLQEARKTRDRRSRSRIPSQTRHSSRTTRNSDRSIETLTHSSPPRGQPRTVSPFTPSVDTISVALTSPSQVSDIAATHQAPSIQSFVYGDLNQDEDTRLPFTSSAPRSEISSALSWSSGLDESNSSNESLPMENDMGCAQFADFAGSANEGWTEGTAVDTVPDTMDTARPARNPRRVLIGS